MNVLVSVICIVLAAVRAAGYPLEGELIPKIVDLSECNHRTRLAALVKELALKKAKKVPYPISGKLRDLSRSVGLDMDQLGLIVGAVWLIKRGETAAPASQGKFQQIAYSLLCTAESGSSPHRDVVIALFRNFEKDYSVIFGSRGLGYNMIIRIIIACHLPYVLEEARNSLFGVFVGLMSPIVPENAAILEPFSEILDALISTESNERNAIVENLKRIAAQFRAQ
jgi:hypothetical protein